jgi:DNA-binding LacI/PurR family transcriptional regulator
MTKLRTEKAQKSAEATQNGGAARHRVTIRDVAEAAGVSPMTVSNVINGKTRFVSEDTRRRVMHAIEQLDYRLLSSGRNLRLGNRQAVGVIIVDESPNFLSHPYISRMVSGFCGTLNVNGYAMIVQGVAPADFANTLALRRAEADAYCIRLHGSREQRADMLGVLARLKEPVVLVQETLPLPPGTRCVVRQDDWGGGRIMADHLAARGVERIWIVLPRFSGPMTEARIGGLQAGFQATGRQASIRTLVCDRGAFEEAYALVDRELASHEAPDAIIGINDELALAALRALQDRSISVPDEVLVAGFNGFHAPSYSKPNLTTVISCPTEVGAKAAEALLRHLRDGSFTEPEIVLPVSFRSGSST